MYSSVSSAIRRSMALNTARQFNPIQEVALAEKCILVDENDRVIGKASKYDCHKVKSDGSILLHRAFSVFIFNSKHEILLQKRSNEKVTFPGYIANACCSHPLFDAEGELEEENALGVKIAAQRRLQHELGIPKHELDLDVFKYMTRIYYKSVGDGTWGEHEIDYILLIVKDVTLNPNPDEVSEVQFVPKNELSSFLTNVKDPVSPWFMLVAKNRLFMWWDNLANLSKFYDHTNINTFSK